MVPEPHVFEHDPHDPQLVHVQGTENIVCCLFLQLYPVTFSPHLGNNVYCIVLSRSEILGIHFHHNMVQFLILNES